MTAEKHYGNLLIKQALRNKEMRETMKEAVRALENGLSASALRLLRAELGESATRIGAVNHEKAQAHPEAKDPQTLDPRALVSRWA